MKKILFFTYDFPYPTTSGGKNRAYHMLKYGGKNSEIHLFSFTRKGFREEYLEELRKIGVKNITLFDRKAASKKELISQILKKPNQSIFKSLYYSREVDEKITRYMRDNSISLFHAESFYTGFYISEERKRMGVKQIYGSENVEHLLYREYVESSVPLYLKPFYAYQVARIKSEEERMIRISNIGLAVSEDDREKLQKLNGAEIRVVDNGIDTDRIKPLHGGRLSRNILFVGNFSYFPNIEAIERFYREVFIHTQKLKLVVVGKDADKKLFFKNDPRVVLHSFVPDLEDIYKDAFVFVFPVRFGGGTNFKVLEAMAYGLPIVGFPDKIRSIRGMSEDTYFRAENFTSMILILNNVREDPALAEKKAQAARTIVEKHYSWGVIGQELSKIWESL